MKNPPHSLHSAGRALKNTLLLGAAAASLALSAAEYDYENGAPPSVTSGDTINVSVTHGSTRPYSVSYFDPATGQVVVRDWNIGPAVITYMPIALGKYQGVTVKPAGDGSTWAQLSGGENHQLITITDPTDGRTTVTLDHLYLADGLGVTGGAMNVANSGNPGTGLVIAGDIIFANNVATDRGGAFNTTRGDMEFTGKILFDGNTANYGGAVAFMAQGTANHKLIFRDDAIFTNNWSTNAGGAIFANSDSGVIKTLEFYGTAVFEGNRAGYGAATSIHGGAIGGGTTGGDGTQFNIAFYNNVSFIKNSAPGMGGAISTAMGHVTFGDDGGFEGSKVVFTRNVGTGGGTGGSARLGGGAISVGMFNATASSASSLFFLNPRMQVLFDRNIAIIRSNSGGTSTSDNSGVGGAARASGGIYLLKGEFEFIGNQGSGHGGALYTHSGNTPKAADYLRYGMIADPSGDAKYDIQVSASSALFQNNVARRNGGAIATSYENDIGSVYIGGNTRFIQNYAGVNGGAINVAGAGALVTLDATTGDITFMGNRRSAGVSAIPTIEDMDRVLANSGTNMDGYMTYGTGSSNDINFAATGTLELNAAAGYRIYMDGGITSSSGANITVIKTGEGAFVLGEGSESAIPATTQIWGGTFKLENASWGNSSAHTFIQRGATLAGWGGVSGRVEGLQGYTILVGEHNDTTARTLVFGNSLAITSGTIKLDFFSAGGVATGNDTITVFGGLTASGITFVDVAGLANGTYTVLSSMDGIVAANNNFRLRAYGAELTRRYQGSTIGIVGTDIIVTGTMLSLPTTWNGASGGIWRDGVDTIWVSSTDSNEKYFRNTDAVTFTDTGAGAIAVSSAGVVVADMVVNSSADYTFTGGAIATTGAVSGNYITATQKLIKRGAGTLTFENTANTFSGGIEMNAGKLAFNNTAQIDTGAAAINFTGDAALQVNASGMTLANAISIAAGRTATLAMGANNLTYAGSLSGSGTLAKTGASTLTLTGNSAGYTGATRVQQGTLTLGNASVLGGSIVLESGATLDGDGASTGSLTANAGSLIQVGSEYVSTPQTLTLNNLTMNGATLRMELYAHAATQTAGTSDIINLTGAYAAGSSPNTFDVMTLKVGEYNLGNVGAFASQSHTVLIGGQSQVGARQTASIANVGGDLILTTTSDDNRRATWTGASGTVWNISGQSWNLDTSTDKTFAGGDNVLFDGASDTAASRTIFIEGYANVSAMEVSGAANYTFTGGAIRADSDYVWGSLITGDGKLLKSGAGTLTFENVSNNFKGGIKLTGGAIAFNNALQLFTSGAGIEFADSASLIANAGGMTLAENISIAGGKTATINTNGYDMVLDGQITPLGAAATFAKAGAGTLYMLADNGSFGGQTTVAVGSLLLAGGARLGGEVIVYAGAVFGGDGSAPGNVNASLGSVIQVGTPMNSGTNPATLTLNALTMSNSSAFTGNGTLRVIEELVLGSGVAGEKIYANVSAGNTLTITGIVTGTNATLVKQDAGTLVLSGTDTLIQRGTTQISGGILKLASDAYRGASSITQHRFLMDGGWLDLGNSGSDTTLYWTGLTFVEGANAAAGGITTSGTSPVRIALGSGEYSFTIGKANTDNMTEQITVLIDPGATRTTWLTGSNNYNAPTLLLSGKLVITDAHQLGSLLSPGSNSAQNHVYMYENTELQISGTAGNTVYTERPLHLYGSAAVTVDAGVESSWRSLRTTGTTTPENITFTKRGEGTLIITSAATSIGEVAFQAGNVNLEAGTLALMHSKSLGGDDDHGAIINVLGNNTTLRLGGRVDVNNEINLGGRTLNLDATLGNSSTYSGNIYGTGGITKTGDGEIVLTNVGGLRNTYSGDTNVNAGTLRFGSNLAVPLNSRNYGIGSKGTLHLDGLVSRLPNINNAGTLIVGNASRSGTGMLPNGTGTTGYVGNNGYLVTDAHGTLHQSNKLTVDNYHGEPGSVLVLNWGLTSATDYTIKFDSLGIMPGGSVSGATTIVFAYQGTADSKMNRRGAILDNMSHNIVDDNVEAGRVFTGTFAVNNIMYAFVSDEYNDLVIEKIGVVPEVVAAKAIDVLALFSGKAALDSLGRRFASLRNETGMPKKGYDIWLGGGYREDRLRETIYEGYGVKTWGVQAGFDFIERDRNGSANFFLGAAFDLMQSHINSDPRSKTDTSQFTGSQLAMVNAWSGPTKTENSSYGVSVYGGMRAGPWYLEGTMRASKDEYKVRLRDKPEYELDMPGSSFGGSLETGYSFAGSESGWIFEPQAQIILQRSTVDPTFDNSSDVDGGARGMIFKVDTIQSMAARAGVRIMKPFEYKPGCMFTPYVRGSILHDFAAENKLTVNNETDVFSNLGGSVGIIEAGFTMRLSKRFDVSFDTSYNYGNKYEGFSFNVGGRFNW